MLKYTIRRLLLAIPVLFLTTVVVFSLMRMVPGDVLVAKLADQGTLTDAQIEEFREEHGLSDPLVVQYFSWLGNLLTGDLGHSIYTGESIRGSLARAAPVTLQLAILAITTSILIGVPVGLISAIKRNTVWDNGLRIFSIVGLSAPEFWTGTMAITFMGLWFHWVPPVGRHVFWEEPIAALTQLAVPAVLIGYRLAAVVARMTRSTVLEVIREDYVRTAQAKGLRSSNVWIRHVLRNSMLPVLTILGGQVVVLIGGTVIIETIFALPGMGRLTLDAINFRDYPLVQTIVFIFAAIVVTVNLVVDLSYAWLDPRVRYG